MRGGESLAVATTAGERQTIALSDGSIVSASGLTRLSATLSEDARSIVLEQGEAFFEVAKDVSRPFIVKAGDTAVTAVGTAFNVRRARERVVVAVAEGRVRIEATGPPPSTNAAPEPVRRIVRLAQLNAGQQLALGPNELEPRIAAIDVHSVGGWREGKLQYLNEPLEIIVADLARYSARHIRIADAEVGALRVTGTVFETNVDAWLESLEGTFPVQVTHRSDGAVELEAR
ncbi:MAG: FecR family protein [Steroidobacteraceae bacterium]